MNKIWFKAKKYGWGWYPATWEGWVVILIYLLIFSVLIYIFNLNIEKFSDIYFISVFLLTVLLIYISYKKGEKPGWHWGDKK